MEVVRSKEVSLIGKQLVPILFPRGEHLFECMRPSAIEEISMSIKGIKLNTSQPTSSSSSSSPTSSCASVEEAAVVGHRFVLSADEGLVRPAASCAGELPPLKMVWEQALNEFEQQMKPEPQDMSGDEMSEEETETRTGGVSDDEDLRRVVKLLEKRGYDSDTAVPQRAQRRRQREARRLTRQV
jgi:hypothetical protein